jgi:hypothetical protein
MAVNDRRRSLTIQYLTEWHGGYWSLHTKEREGIAQRIAENVCAYHRRLNIPAYTRVAQEMLDDGTIKISQHADGALALDFEHLQPQQD